jgi:hypothetical protein
MAPTTLNDEEILLIRKQFGKFLTGTRTPEDILFKAADITMHDDTHQDAHYDIHYDTC